MSESNQHTSSTQSDDSHQSPKAETPQQQLLVQRQQIQDLTTGLQTLVQLHQQRPEAVLQPYLNTFSIS